MPVTNERRYLMEAKRAFFDREQHILTESVMEAGGEYGLQDVVRARLETKTNSELMLAEARRLASLKATLPEPPIEMVPAKPVSLAQVAVAA